MEGNGLPESLESKFLSNPNTPVLRTVKNIRVGIINVSKHQVVVVAKFRCIHILTQFFLLIMVYYFVYLLLPILFDYSQSPRNCTSGTSSDCTYLRVW